MIKVYNKRSAGGTLFLLSAFSFLLLVSCSQEEFLPQETDSDAVKISASIGALQTRVSYNDNGVTTFQSGDEIRVISHTRQNKDKSDAVYKFDGSMYWEPADPADYVVWEGITDNTFYGVYPHTADYDKFTIPTNQSGGVQVADWMTDDFTANKSVGKVEFAFQHRLAKVTVNITKWNNEFTGTDEITEPKIYTNGTDVKATYENGSAIITATGENTQIDPLVNGASFTAIVAPLKYDVNDRFMTFTVDGQEMTVFAKNGTLTGGLQPGNHYTFDLTVGKNAVTIKSVSVTKWDEKDINGGVAKECEHNFVDGICTECGAEASYTYDESSNVYRLYKAEYLKETIEEASNTGTSMNPATIILMDDITVPQGTSEDWMFEFEVEFNKGIVELDLNGKTLTTAISLDVTATLVIHDSSNGSGQIVSSSGECLVGVAESGALTINGGTLNSTGNNYGAVVGYGGHITINGGKIMAKSTAVTPQNSPLIITGGEFLGEHFALEFITQTPSIDIIGGSFTGGKYDIETSGQTGFLSFNYGTGEGPRFPGGISIYNRSGVTNFTLNPLLASDAEYVDANGEPITISDDADSYEGNGDVIVKRKQEN